MNEVIKRGFSFYLKLSVVLFAVVSAYSYIVYTSAGGSTKSGIYYSIVGAILMGCATFFIKRRSKDWLMLAEVALLSASFALFIASDDVILTFVDYIYKIDYWGNTALIPNIISTAVFFLISVALAVVVCFIDKHNENQEG